MGRLPIAARQAPLIAISIFLMAVAAAYGISVWWFWAGMIIGLLAQIAVACGLGEEKEYWNRGRG